MKSTGRCYSFCKLVLMNGPRGTELALHTRDHLLEGPWQEREELVR